MNYFPSTWSVSHPTTIFLSLNTTTLSCVWVVIYTGLVNVINDLPEGAADSCQIK